MTELLLASAKNVPCETYKAACERAVSICDLERTVLLLEKADGCVKDLDMGMYGDVIKYALFSSENRGKTYHIAMALVKQCTPEQVCAADPYLLDHAVTFQYNDLAYELIKKGFAHDPAQIFYAVARNDNVQAFYMFGREMKDTGQYIGALRHCMRRNDLNAATFLLNHGSTRGVDFEAFRESVDTDKLNNTEKSFLGSLTHYWEDNIKP